MHATIALTNSTTVGMGDAGTIEVDMSGDFSPRDHEELAAFLAALTYNGFRFEITARA